MTSANPSQHEPTRDAGDKSDPAKPKIPPASTKPELQPPHTHCEIVSKTEKDWRDKVKPYLKIVGVALLAVYTLFTIKMYRANNRAANASAQAATEAANQTRLLRQQLVSANAAIVKATFTNPPEGILVAVWNNGHAIATDFRFSFNITRIHLRSQQPIGKPEHREISLAQVPSGGDQVQTFMQSLSALGIHRETWKTMQQTTPQESVEINGEYVFDDGFGDQYKMPICKIWYAHLQLGNNSDGNWIDCVGFREHLKFWDGLERAEAERKPQN